MPEVLTNKEPLMTLPRTIRPAVLFVVALAAWPRAAADEPTVDLAALRATSATLIDRLAAGEYAKALEAYDRPADGGMTADKLHDEWQKVVRQAGALRGRT